MNAVSADNDSSGFRGPGQNDYNSDYYLYIGGGYIAIDALGDGIDINGLTYMDGGYLIINGPTQNMTVSEENGLYSGGTYTRGSLITSFTISSIVTTLGSSGGGFPGGPGGPGF